MIALACDHTGVDLKMEIMHLLDEMGLEYKDFGTNTRESCKNRPFPQG
ncbi:MAG: RpiB/LacA/LacB family sugar-phosphate isomerase [Clostridia bacterium]|nr:RpiB/LacA/LacB family sugar-phosphate isomerase [Clostridia bacterium]